MKAVILSLTLMILPIFGFAAEKEDAFANALSSYKAKHYAEAANAFLTLARKSHGLAQVNMAVLYAKGQGVLQNDAKAWYWAWRGRFSGAPNGPKLVKLLARRLPLKTREMVAKALHRDYQNLISEGALEHSLALGRAYHEAPQEPDLIKAYIWYNIAAALNIDKANWFRDALRLELEFEDVIKAQTQTVQKTIELCALLSLDLPMCIAAQEVAQMSKPQS